MEKFATTKITVKTTDVVPNEFNPNVMSEYVYEKMKQTIKEKGLFGSIIVVPFGGIYKIIDGEHRLKACTELGYTEIPVECGPEMTDDEVRFWTIYFNNTRGKDDVEKRASILKQLEDGQTSLLPFTQEEIDNEKALFSFDFEQYNKESTHKERIVTNAVMIPVTEQEYDLWIKTKEILKRENKTEGWFITDAMNNFLQLYSL